jgi:hypothetical protein
LRRGESVANQCVTKFFAIFLLSDIIEIQTRLPYNTNYKDLVKRLISESRGCIINDLTPAPLLEGEGRLLQINALQNLMNFGS